MKKALVSTILAVTLAASAPANAALTAMLSLKGSKSGEIKGSVIQKGREGKIAVIAVEHHITQPTAGGVASGKRQQGVFTITKEVDKASVPMLAAFASNEPLSFELQFWQPVVTAASGVGTEKQFYTVKLTNARIVDFKLKMANNKNPELVRFAEYEEISFVYESINWTWTDGGITTTMSASAP